MVICKQHNLYYFCRVEEVFVRYLLPVWSDLGYCGIENSKDERPGICYIQGHQQ